MPENSSTTRLSSAISGIGSQSCRGKTQQPSPSLTGEGCQSLGAVNAGARAECLPDRRSVSNCKDREPNDHFETHCSLENDRGRYRGRNCYSSGQGFWSKRCE